MVLIIMTKKTMIEKAIVKLVLIIKVMMIYDTEKVKK